MNLKPRMTRISTNSFFFALIRVIRGSILLVKNA